MDTSILKVQGSWRMSIPACWWYCDEYVSIKRYLKTKLSRFGPTEMGSSFFFHIFFLVNFYLANCGEHAQAREIKQSRLGWSLRLAQVSFWRLYLHSSSIFALCHWPAGHLDYQCHIGIGGLLYQLLGSTWIWLVHVQHCSASILCGDVEWAEHC